MQKFFLPVRKIFSFLCGNAIFAFKASLVCFTFLRIFKVHKNFRCWIYFSSSGFAWCFRWGTIRNNLVQNWKCQWEENVSVRKQFSKISWKTEQVSCLRKWLFLTLRNYCLSLFEKAILTFVLAISHGTMWQHNVSFRNFLCLFPYFWNWIKTTQVRWLICQLENFALLGNLWCRAYLHLQYLIFLMTISLEVLFFEKNLVCFQKWSRLRIVPFLSVRRAWDEKWSREIRP